MKCPPLGPGGEDITWRDQVAPRGQKASSDRKIKPQTSKLKPLSVVDLVLILKIPRRRYYCAHFACDIARTSAHSRRFVDFCTLYVLMVHALFSSGTKI